MRVFKQVPFPAHVRRPSKLAALLAERIKYMFEIEVEPVIIRHPGSYYKTREFRFNWSMRTYCGRYEIACYEPAGEMARKPAWHVLDQVPLLAYQSNTRITGKIIY
jgi:hypothetical protein